MAQTASAMTQNVVGRVHNSSLPTRQDGARLPRRAIAMASLTASLSADAPSPLHAAGAGLLVLAQDTVLRMWALNSLGTGSAPPAPLLLAAPAGVAVLAVGQRRDGTRLLAAASSDELILHSFAPGEPLQPQEAARTLALESFGGRAELRAALFDGSARRLALCAGAETWLVDAGACRPLLRLQGHAAPTSLCCFVGCSRWLKVPPDLAWVHADWGPPPKAQDRSLRPRRGA